MQRFHTWTVKFFLFVAFIQFLQLTMNFVFCGLVRRVFLDTVWKN